MPQDRPQVLVVEDNLLIAVETEFLVHECGCAVIGPVGSVGEALGTVRGTDLDGAVLDINVGDERVWPVAELLRNRGVPFVLATGHQDADVPERFRKNPLLIKPLTLDSLEGALREIGAVPG